MQTHIFPPLCLHQATRKNLYDRRYLCSAKRSKSWVDCWTDLSDGSLCKNSSNYVEPDLSIIYDKNKLNDQGCKGAPDFIIEIVSPSSRKMDYATKNTLYSNAGVREYWIIDPQKERTTVYYYEEDAAPTIIPFCQKLSVGIYKDLQICISELL